VQQPTSYFGVCDGEILVSEAAFTVWRRMEELGLHPRSYDHPWEGLNYPRKGSKFTGRREPRPRAPQTGSRRRPLYALALYSKRVVVGTCNIQPLTVSAPAQLIAPVLLIMPPE
jgi:hypothetical protein